MKIRLKDAWAASNCFRATVRWLAGVQNMQLRVSINFIFQPLLSRKKMIQKMKLFLQKTPCQNSLNFHKSTLCLVQGFTLAQHTNTIAALLVLVLPLTIFLTFFFIFLILCGETRADRQKEAVTLLEGDSCVWKACYRSCIPLSWASWPHPQPPLLGQPTGQPEWKQHK